MPSTSLLSFLFIFSLFNCLFTVYLFYTHPGAIRKLNVVIKRSISSERTDSAFSKILHLLLLSLCGLSMAGGFPATTFITINPTTGADKPLIIQSLPGLMATTQHFSAPGSITPKQTDEFLPNTTIEIRRGADSYGPYDEYHLIHASPTGITRYFAGRCYPVDLDALQELSRTKHTCWRNPYPQSEIEISNPLAHVTFQLAYSRSGCHSGYIMSSHVDISLRFKVGHPEPENLLAYSFIHGTLATTSPTSCPPP